MKVSNAKTKGKNDALGTQHENKAARKFDKMALALLSTMKKNPTDSLAQWEGCHKLRLWMNDKEKCLAILRAGGLDCLLLALKNHPHHVNVQQACLATLIEILRKIDESESTQYVVQNGGVDAVISSMKYFQADSIIQDAGCMFLCDAVGLECQDILLELVVIPGVHGPIISALQHFPKHERIQKSGLLAFYQLSRFDVNLLDNEEVIKTIIASLSNFLHSLLHQACGLAILATIVQTRMNDGRYNDTLARISSCGGLLRVWFAMKTYRCDVPGVAVCLLSHLATSAQNRAFLLRLDGLYEVLWEIAKQHKDQTATRDVCLTMFNLRLGEGGKHEWHTTGEAVKAALYYKDKNLREEDSLIFTRSMLISMATALVDDQDPILVQVSTTETGLMSSIAGEYTESQEFQYIFWSISILAKGRNIIKEAIADCGGIDFILSEMKRSFEDGDIQEAGCEALSEIALYNDPNCSQIASLGGIDHILKLMESYKSNRGVLEKANRVLSYLVYNDEIKASMLKQRGGLVRMIDNFLRYEWDEFIGYYAYAIMARLAYEPAHDTHAIDEAIEEG